MHLILTTCLHICVVLKFFWVYRLRYNSNSMMFCLLCLESPFWCIFFLTLFTFNFSYQRKCSLCFLRVTGEPTILIFCKNSVQKYISCGFIVWIPKFILIFTITNFTLNFKSIFFSKVTIPHFDAYFYSHLIFWIKVCVPYVFSES